MATKGRANLKNLAAGCEEKAKDTINCAKRYYHTFNNEMTIFHPYGKKTYL
jgi:hypothetical protein